MSAAGHVPTVVTRRVREHLEDPAASPGTVVLVDRLWPRGVRKADLEGVRWAKDVAPSAELRAWYHGLAEQERAECFDEFVERYQAELASSAADAVDALAADVGADGATLLYALRDTEHNHAQVLAAVLRERLGG